MKLHPAALVVTTAAVITGLTGCGAIGATSASPAAPDSTVAAGLGSAAAQDDSDTTDSEAGSTDADSTGSDTTGSGSTKAPSSPKHSSKPKPKPHGPRVVSFKVIQKPKCAEGTAVFRAEAVPLVIKWKITGADSAALSVDDPTGTPGTYGQVEREGTQEFTFSCAGEVGSTETHTYAIYTVGGGTQRHKTLKVSAKVLDKGLGTN
jgi:hypothetical protein